MTRPSQRKRDAIEPAIEAALEPGNFIGYGTRHEFLEDLEKQIASVASTDADRAAALYETFIAGCYEKAEEVDDSGGMFGESVGNLFAGWVRARQAACADADETARRLLAWMDDDPYCLAHELERHVATVLEKAGAAAFERLARERMTSPKATPGRGGDEREVARRRWGRVLRTLFAARRNLRGYVALCEEMDDVTPADCGEVAKMLAARQRPKEALEWVERGLALEANQSGFSGMHDLQKMKRDLLQKLGRGGEALALAWEKYQTSPHRYSYEDLMQYVPRGERAKWHAKAMDAARKGDLHSAIELFLATRETDRLLARLRGATDEELEKLSHYSTEPVASKLTKSHPDLAARIYRALGVRILKAKKSKYYNAALSNLEKARRLYEKVGAGAEWEALVAEIRADHHRKTGFMARFEELVRGGKATARPSFIERAKARSLPGG